MQAAAAQAHNFWVHALEKQIDRQPGSLLETIPFGLTDRSNCIAESWKAEASDFLEEGNTGGDLVLPTYAHAFWQLYIPCKIQSNDDSASS